MLGADKIENKQLQVKGKRGRPVGWRKQKPNVEAEKQTQINDWKLKALQSAVKCAELELSLYKNELKLNK